MSSISCNSNNKYWSNEFYCSQPRGACDENASPFPLCVCNQGYMHDMTMGRYRDCRVPLKYFIALDTLIVICSLLAFAFTLYNFKGSKSLARRILMGCFGTEICIFTFGILRLFQNHAITGASFFMFFMIFSFVTLVAYASSYSMALPLRQLARQAVEPMYRTYFISFICFRIITFLPLIVAIVMFEDATNPTLDYGWNVCIVTFALLATFEIVFINITNFINSLNMIKTITKLKEATNNLSRVKTHTADEYLQRIRGALTIQYYLVPITLIITVILPLLFYITNYLPYQFIPMSFIYLAFPVIAFKRTKFATLQKVGTEVAVLSVSSSDLSPKNQSSSHGLSNQ